MIKKIIIKITGTYYKWNGYSAYFSNKIFFKLADDFRKKNGNLSSKIWAYKRGFLSQSVYDLGIHQKNLKDYLPDLAYFKLHPLNPKFGKWIDDKLTMKYILRPFSEYLPEYYFHIFRKEVLPVLDCPAEYSGSAEDVLKLLQLKKKLAFKPVRGALGTGFFVIEQNTDEYYINNKPIGPEMLKEKITSLDDYIITEYITAHESLRKISPDSPNAIRVVVIRTDAGECSIAAAYARIGTKTTGIMEIMEADGIICKIDRETGTYAGAKRKTGNRYTDWQVHPDSGLEIKGELPNWNLIKQIIHKISDYLPQLRYMGFDIAITDNGFKILEINSLPGLTMQHFFPLLKNEQTAGFFKSRM